MAKRSRKILVYTDSRGQHKRAFADREIFTEKLQTRLEHSGHAVDLVLCPFKWTTTIDLIELIERGIVDPRAYDNVVLYTGAVEWAPRDASSWADCMSGLGDPLDPAILFDNRRRRRIANDKLSFFRRFFGEAAYDRHADVTFDVHYRGQPTKNLISLDMLRGRVVPYLKQTFGEERLVVINANRIVPGWDGDYLAVNPDGRPANMAIIEAYSAALRDAFADCIDLLAWSHDEVRAYTVDNVHLSHAGSEWLLERVLSRLA